MALADIVQKILEDAQSDAKQLVHNAEAEAQKIKKDAEDQATKISEKSQEEIEQKSQEMERKTKTLAESERKNLFLNKKRALLEKAFNEAKKELSKMPEKDLVEAFVAFLTTIDEKDGTIYPAKGQKGIIEKALKTASKNYKTGEEKDFAGGFLFVGKSSEIDFSFDSIVDKNVRPKVELKIAKILFEGSNAS